MENNIVLVYDINSLPEVGNSEESSFGIVSRLYKEAGIVIWDSSYDNVEPKLLQIGEGLIPEIKVVDTKNLTDEEVKQLILRKDD